MKLPRLRFSMRRMMVAVILIAVTLAILGTLQRRRDRFERLFSYHRGRTGRAVIRSFDPGNIHFDTAKGRWHWDLSIKYGEAARRPWLPVASDPPEPE